MKCHISLGEGKLKACKMLTDISGPQRILWPSWRQVCSAGTGVSEAQCSTWNAVVQGPGCHLWEEEGGQGTETSPHLLKNVDRKP